MTQGRGPLGALPGLSPSARRALALCAVLAVASAAAVIGQAWALAAALAGMVAGTGLPSITLPVLACTVIARALLGWATQIVAARAAAGAKEELRGVLVDRALGNGPEWIAARGPGELTALGTKNLDALDAYFGTYLPALVTAVAAPLGVGIAVLATDWPSAVVVALTVPLIPVFAILIGRYTEDRVGPAAEATERLSGHLLELLRALPVLTAFRRAEAQVEVVRRVSETHRRGTLGVLRVAFSSAFALELVATLSVALVAVLIGLRLVSGDMTLAVGLFVLIVVPECYLPLRAAGSAHHASADGLEAVRRVAKVPVTPVSGGASVVDFRELRVEGLRVRRRDTYAPDGLSLVVRSGEIVRLDSPSGSGKSTLFAVLLGFVSHSDGNVLVDGVPLTHIDMSTWRRIVSWVPQRPAFATATVADEVGPAPREVMVEKAREVAAEHLLDRRIADLSTGERQRVAVLRALLRPDTRLLLLDEPTAHLDPATAGLVMLAIQRAADQGVAVLLATHRAVTPDEGNARPAEAVTVADSIEGAGGRLRTLFTRRTLMGAALGAASLVSGIALTALSAWLIARASQQPPILTLSVAVVGVRMFGLTRAGLRYVERLVTHDAAFRTATDLRVRLWAGLVRLGPARSPRGDDGLRRLVDDVDVVRDLTPRVLVPPLVAIAVTVSAVIVQTAILPAAGLVLLAALVLAGIGAPWLTLVAERRATIALARGRRAVAAQVLTLFDAAADLIAFGRDVDRQAELVEADAVLAVRTRSQAFGAGAGSALVTVLVGAAMVASVGLAPGVNLVLVPILALVPLAVAEALMLLPPAVTHLATLRAAHGRVTSVLAQRREADTALAGSEVLLVDVDVRWPGGDGVALSGVNLRVPPRTHVAVVGPSGAGKSTLIALLLGFLSAERGTVTRPARIAWCPQEPTLVSTTVRENLRLAAPDATDSELHAVLTRVCLDIDLDTRLDAAGRGISGGEAQRLALGRAMLADADLILLDEPTAHLDEPTARRVLASLRETDRTIVHITHRVEETVEADMVIEVADGRVRELVRG
ncbi:MAG: thiol reductant ABC exporter subunit CydD [Actinomycetota bacterium]|nr:thiol reductant ABC exporter subunit CydD [Actinomycetota bacterium]